MGEGKGGLLSSLHRIFKNLQDLLLFPENVVCILDGNGFELNPVSGLQLGHFGQIGGNDGGDFCVPSGDELRKNDNRFPISGNLYRSWNEAF